jgi:hypothetical protein
MQYGDHVSKLLKKNSLANGLTGRRVACLILWESLFPGILPRNGQPDWLGNQWEPKRMEGDRGNE